MSRLSPTALVVVDVQNDFCHADGVFGQSGHDLSAVHAMVPRLSAGIQAWRSAGQPVVYVRTAHSDDTDSPAWLHRSEAGSPKTCRVGSWGAEYFGIEPDAADVVIAKSRYSGFHRTTLEAELKARGVREVLVAGVLSNVCVESTIREGCLRDFQMVMLEDCCASYDEHLHRGTVENVRRYFGSVQDSRRLLAAADPDEPRR